MIKNYFLGCPIWSHKGWVGSFFTQGVKSKDHLKEYAQVLTTVEGNTTFYGLPKQETIQRWHDETPKNFKFCFKFPKIISHTHQLFHVTDETKDFLKRLEILHEKIGLFFLQLPPSFSSDHLQRLEGYFKSLPKDFNYAVEVRHRDFFEAPGSHRLDSLLRNFGVNRVIFDTKTLHAIDSNEESIQEAQRKKPKVPEYFVATGKQPFLRFVGGNMVESNLSRLNDLAEIVMGWIKEDCVPYVFMHSPDSVFEPQLCQKFHEILLGKKPANMDIGTFPSFPAENDMPLFGFGTV